MKNLTRQNPRQLIVAQELINKVKSKCCGIKVSDILTNTISGFKYSSCISDPRKQPFGMYYYMNTFPYIVDVTGNVSNWRHLSINF